MDPFVSVGPAVEYGIVCARSFFVCTWFSSVMTNDAFVYDTLAVNAVVGGGMILRILRLND